MSHQNSLDSNFEKFRAKFSTLIAIRSALLDAIATFLTTRAKGHFDYNLRHSLIAQYLQGVELSFQAIGQGLYAPAANLQKQQIETLAALKECRLDRRRNKKTPNVGNYLPQMKAEYDNLNDVAHPSSEDELYELTASNQDGKATITPFPKFREDISRAMLSNHCYYLFGLFIEISELFEPNPPKGLSDEEHSVFEQWKKYKCATAKH